MVGDDSSWGLPTGVRRAGDAWGWPKRTLGRPMGSRKVTVIGLQSLVDVFNLQSASIYDRLEIPNRNFGIWDFFIFYFIN